MQITRIRLLLCAALSLSAYPTSSQQINANSQIRGQVRPNNGGTGVDTTGMNNACPKIIGGVWTFSTANCSSGGGNPGGSNLQVQFNNSGSFGGTQITTDSATKSNLTVPGNFSAAGAAASFTGTNWPKASVYQTTNCTLSSIVGYANEAGLSQGCVAEPTFLTNPGQDDGNGVVFAFTQHDMTGEHRYAGIHSIFGGTITAPSIGDTNLLNFYLHSRPGFLAAGDEVNVGGRFHFNEDPQPVGTVTVGGTGVNSLTVNFTQTGYTLGVGHPLINLSHPQAVTVTASTPVTSRPGFALQTVTGATFTPSVCAIITSVITPPGQQYDQKSSPQSFTVTGISGALTTPLTTGSAYVVGANQEYVNITTASAISGGSQTLTAGFSHRYFVSNNGMICQGGPAGSQQEMTAFTTTNANSGYGSFSSQKFTHIVVGAASSSSLYVTDVMAGGPSTNILTTGAANIYPAVTVTNAAAAASNRTSPATFSFSIDSANNTSFAVGDTVQQASVVPALWQGYSTIFYVANPYAQQFGHTMQATSPGFQANSFLNLQSAYDPTKLSSRGGYGQAWDLVQANTTSANTPFGNGLAFQNGPEGNSSCNENNTGSLLCVQNGMVAGSAKTSYNLFAENSHGSTINFTTGTDTNPFRLTFGNFNNVEFASPTKFDNPITAGSINFNGYILPVTPGTGYVGYPGQSLDRGYINYIYPGVMTASTLAATSTGGYLSNATAANVASTLSSATGCSTAGYVYVPQSNTCVAQTAGTSIANIQFDIPPQAVAANSCNAVQTQSMPGLLTTSTLTSLTPISDPTTAIGFGNPAYPLVYVPRWPTANTLNYKVCNNTTTAIMSTTDFTFNQGAK